MIAAQMTTQYQQLVTSLQSLLENTYLQNFMQSSYLYELAAQTPLGVTIPPLAVIQAAIKNPIPKLTLPSLMEHHRNEIVRKIDLEISQSLMAGEDYAKMAKRIEKAVGFSRAKAHNVARTEAGRVRSVARNDSAEIASKHANLVGVWNATLDMRTRPDHRKLDGQEADKDGYFHIHGLKAKGPHLFGVAKEDCQCRCVKIFKVNGKLPDTRRARDYQDAAYQQKLADRIDKYMADGMTEKQAEKRAKKEISAPSVTIPYQPYNEWLNGKKKVKSKQKSEPSLADISIAKTNMKERVGEDNYNQFAEHLNRLKDSKLRALFEKFGDQVGFMQLKNGRAYARFSSVQLAQVSFDGNEYEQPLEIVYHEIGHAFDSIGLKAITGKNVYATGNTVKHKIGKKKVEVDEYITLLSSMPKYKLKETIKRDLWEYVNGRDLPMYEDIGKRPRKKAEKLKYDELRSKIYETSTANFEAFEKNMIEKYGKTSKQTASLSDIYEATPFTFKSYPFGVGHGKAYYKKKGTAETEFFAEIAESRAANNESYALLSEIFPNAIKAWETIVDDMLKAGD
ncbi:phage minor head protein [Sporolactobacillus terrae]|uniref:phage minor head protein n=1 Tax=Sporolactobacillus terrae TaxID=269673 RepID=UPI001E57A206|nr:phage minor head protein [Sporolactobacillus terrae]